MFGVAPPGPGWLLRNRSVAAVAALPQALVRAKTALLSRWGNVLLHRRRPGRLPTYYGFALSLLEGAHRMYGHHIEIAAPFDRVLERVQAALKAEGFGVLSDIDIQKAMKEKLGKDMPAYRILGACYPSLAHQALQADPEIGLLLPCNVTVRQAEGDCVVVGFLDPQTMVQLTNNAAVGVVANDVGERLLRVRNALQQAA